MDKYVKLAEDSIKYYLENENYLREYDNSFKSNNNGVIINVSQDEKLERVGSIYPTRADIGLDIIYEAVNATVFNNAIDMRELDNLYLSVFEVSKIVPIQYIEEFGMYHGLSLKYKNENIIVFRNDYESDYQMFEDALAKANVDSFDVFSLEKFKVTKHI